ncbi:hypothetical protein HPB49_014072 [Dermacentor silvarum]|uniref:Uncharacterized protein n=2 Tax=Dermacentor silvarum TaxID=543639 RepID=A0ACB8DDP8_DERSI|nr:uncharacterized protein LOC119441168 isoform X4 [Dermacentor silvarum]KAH7966160.1 hypothetical protein HPB49_014072 [Dermacentor silvarum]
MAFRWPLLVAAAATAITVIPTALSINVNVDRVLQDDALSDVIANAAGVEFTRNFYIWNSSWWFWPEFYAGRIIGLGKELRQFGGCAFEIGDAAGATCDMDHVVLKLRYRWRVGVKDPSLEKNRQQSHPLHVIDAGSMTATMAGGPIQMTLQKDFEGNYFRAKEIDLGVIEIKDVVFRNSTITWKGEQVDTNDVVFQCRLRELLDYVLYKYFKDLIS